MHGYVWLPKELVFIDEEKEVSCCPKGQGCVTSQKKIFVDRSINHTILKISKEKGATSIMC